VAGGRCRGEKGARNEICGADLQQTRPTWRALPARRPTGDHGPQRLIDELTASGEFPRIYRLADATNARTVALRDGVPAVTDGPFGESKEVLASLWEMTS
jgi:hypothetical protein